MKQKQINQTRPVDMDIKNEEGNLGTCRGNTV